MTVTTIEIEDLDKMSAGNALEFHTNIRKNAAPISNDSADNFHIQVGMTEDAMVDADDNNGNWISGYSTEYIFNKWIDDTCGGMSEENINNLISEIHLRMKKKWG